MNKDIRWVIKERLKLPTNRRLWEEFGLDDKELLFPTTIEKFWSWDEAKRGYFVDLLGGQANRRKTLRLLEGISPQPESENDRVTNQA